MHAGCSAAAQDADVVQLVTLRKASLASTLPRLRHLSGAAIPFRRPALRPRKRARSQPSTPPL